MTATETTVAKILEVTGQPEEKKEVLTPVIQSYYDNRGHVSKHFTVGIVIEKLGVSLQEFSGPISKVF